MNRRNLSIALALAALLALLLWGLRTDKPMRDAELTSTPRIAADPQTTEDTAAFTAPESTPPTETVADIESSEESVGEPIVTAALDFETGGAIQGSVSDAWTGHPIQRFDLLLKRGQFLNFNPRKHRGFRAHHDPLGLFFLNDLPAEGLTVFVRAEGYESDLRYLPGVRPDIAVADVDFMLHPHASLKVVVVDQFGQPVDGADVVLAAWEQAQWGGAHPEARTDEQGMAHFSELAPGPTHITVFHASTFVESHARVTIENENVARVVFVGKEPIQGHVYYDGQPRPGVLLTLNAAGRTPTVMTDAEGYFAFQYVPNMSGRLNIRIPEYPHMEFTFTLEVDTLRDYEPIHIDIPAFETGFRLNVDIKLAEREEAVLNFSGTLPSGQQSSDGLSFRHSVNIREGTVFELAPIPLWDYSVNVQIAKRTNAIFDMIATGRLDTTNMLQSGKLLVGTIHGERPRPDVLRMSVTGDYAPL